MTNFRVTKTLSVFIFFGLLLGCKQNEKITLDSNNSDQIITIDKFPPEIPPKGPPELPPGESYWTIDLGPEATQQLILAAQTINIPSGQTYNVGGSIQCSEESVILDSCKITIGATFITPGKSAFISDANAITESIRERNLPHDGLTPFFIGNFVVSSITSLSGVVVSQAAKIRIFGAIPNWSILEVLIAAESAASGVSASELPAKLYIGVINCIAYPAASATGAITAHCEINHDGNLYSLRGAAEIVRSLNQVEPIPGDSYFSFSGNFLTLSTQDRALVVPFPD